MANPDPSVVVFAPNLMVTVTVEDGPGRKPEVHFHAGGQGFWIARMVAGLGEDILLCAPMGGETGRVARALLASTGVQVLAVEAGSDTPCYLHDRRGGERIEIARTPGLNLSRHEADSLYGAILGQALSSGMCIVTGSPDPPWPSEDFYRRLGGDLAAANVRVVADIHGAALSAFLSGGQIEMLKVSDEDLRNDGALPTDDDDDAVRSAIRELVSRGARNVVVSRAGDPSLAYVNGSWFSVGVMELRVADHRGSGDSMTAGLAVGLLRGLDPVGLLRLGSAAGAANVTRHGLGSADVSLVGPLAERVAVRCIEDC